MKIGISAARFRGTSSQTENGMFQMIQIQE
jgi:hypothetical protein